jgi:hypothetical protein
MSDMAEILYITKFAAITRFHAQMKRAARRADRTGDEGPYEAASDRLWDAINMVRAHGTAADKASLRQFLRKNYAATLCIAIAFVAVLAGTAQARDRDRLDPAYQGGDIHICRGLLTSSGTCIGSESNVEPSSYDGTTIYRRPDRDRDRDDDRDQDQDK